MTEQHSNTIEGLVEMFNVTAAKVPGTIEVKTFKSVSDGNKKLSALLETAEGIGKANGKGKKLKTPNEASDVINANVDAKTKAKKVVKVDVVRQIIIKDKENPFREGSNRFTVHALILKAKTYDSAKVAIEKAGFGSMTNRIDRAVDKGLIGLKEVAAA